jgi:hypothetical protein
VNRANAQQIVDVNTFIAWVSAIADERQLDPNSSRAPDGTYTPDPATDPTPFALPSIDSPNRRKPIVWRRARVDRPSSRGATTSAATTTC